MLFPIIIPRKYNKDGRWIGPLKNLRHPELAVTWVTLHEPGTMTYLSFDAAKQLRNSGCDYQAEAMINLRAASKERLYTHHKEEGDNLIFVVAMHEDGLGSSRLLLLPEWTEEFPDGFQFGLPERSCALVIPQSRVQSSDALEIIQNCYNDGCTSMLPGLHSPTLFELEDS